MATKLFMSEDEKAGNTLSHQAISFFLHSAIAVGAWLALMLAGYALNPSTVPQSLILLLSVAVALAAGYFFVQRKPDEMAAHVWLAGLIWVLIVSLWIVDMPTGPNACNDCGASEKLMRALFSIPRPSGLLDDNAPFLCTWPAAALVGYSIGARLAFRRRRAEE
jgi:hypothetical protein